MKGKAGIRGDRTMDLILVIGAVIVVAVFVWLVVNSGKTTGGEEPKNATTTTVKPTYRRPAVAGSFYPADKKQLTADIDRYLSQAKDYPQVWGIRGLVSPHAGYVYSAPVAAYGYRQLTKSRYETVIVLGPSHHVYLKKAYIPDVTHFETPLGPVPISPKVKEMLKEDIFTSKPAGADGQEHSIEVQVPFLQKVLPPFKLIPVMVGDVDPVKLADALMKYVDDDTLLVASSDLSHYKPYDQCVATDNRTVNAIVALDTAGMASVGDACGKVPVLALMEIGRRKGWRTQLFDYRNSGDTSGDKSQGVVGYASVGFYDGLGGEEQRILLDLAEGTLVRHYKGEEAKVDERTLPPKLLEEKACFVTLNKNKQLRGCIGHLTPQTKLYKCVIENALNAALYDGRFNPVEEGELKDIKVEISVLTLPKRLSFEGPDDLLAKLIPGVDGLIIKNGYKQSTYLPVVWEMLPNKEQFLSELCMKGGNPANCWKTPGTEIYTYQAQEFHQEGFK